MKKQALLIGIDSYDFLGDLNYARNDAETLASDLVEFCNFSQDEITLMCCGVSGGLRAQSDYIEDLLSEHARLEDLDLYVFGFWGHGFIEEGNNRYLCSINTRQDRLARTAVSFDFVKSKLAQVSANNTLLVLDCCQARSAGRAGQQELSRGIEEDFQKVARLIQAEQPAVRSVVPSIAILNSCRDGQLAYEWPEREHGIFSAYVSDAIHSGVRSVSGISQFVSERVPKTSRSIYRKEQNPWFVIEGSGDFEIGPPPSVVTQIEAASTVPSAENYIDHKHRDAIIEEFRNIVFSYRRENPISIAALTKEIEESLKIYFKDNDDLLTCLDQARAQGAVSGYFFNEDKAFLAVEKHAYKFNLNTPIKKMIGSVASSEILDRSKIGIDGGSTVMCLVDELIELLQARVLTRVEVYTNSIEATYKITRALIDMDLGDEDQICSVFMIPGWCRPKSNTVVPSMDRSIPDAEERIPKLVETGVLPEKLDISFIGADGVHAGTGFGMSGDLETPMKRYFCEHSDTSFFLLESRKLLISQPEEIVPFNQNTTLICDTNHVDNDRAQKVIKSMVNAGAKVKQVEH